MLFYFFIFTVQRRVITFRMEIMWFFLLEQFGEKIYAPSFPSRVTVPLTVREM